MGEGRGRRRVIGFYAYMLGGESVVMQKKKFVSFDSGCPFPWSSGV